MSAALAFDLTLCALVIGVAIAAVTGRDLFGSFVFFIVYGLLVAIAWVRLGAVDVALAEAAIGAGLTGVLLVGAIAKLPVEEPEPPRRAARAATALLCAAVAAALSLAVLTLSAASPGLIPMVADNLASSGVGNPVTAVLLNFRAYDTLLESVVLLVALIGVWSLAPDRLWGGVPGLRQRTRPDGVLATFGRTLPPVGLLIGVYLVWAGGEMPGGAFQAGTVLAAVWLLLAMAGQIDAPPVSDLRLRVLLVAGPGLFLAVGIVGAAAGIFLGYPPDAAKAIILTIEFVLTASIAATLALLVAGAPRRAP